MPKIPQINFERLVSRQVARRLSKLLDLAGIKMSINKLLEIIIVGSFAIFVIALFALYALKFSMPVDIVLAFVSAGVYIAAIYMVLQYFIDKRKTLLEQMLPDYFQIASANLRSGIALDRALLLAARPEFKFFSDDVKDMGRRVLGGETLDTALNELAGKYRSFQLQHAVRMMLEAVRFGGAMADLLDQLSRDLRNQQLMQKEVAGQLLMYSIFIAFAGLIAAPVLYGLTSQMIVVTDTVWKGILAQNPGGLPTTGVSFLKPSPPKISPNTYHEFSILAIITITGFASLIMSAISSGSAIKGIRYLPIFIVAGFGIYLVVQNLIGAIFSSIGSV
ncbi:MAG: type II secretion system F family protein, partial [Candidatus Micrarchaeia archaeon]